MSIVYLVNQTPCAQLLDKLSVRHEIFRNFSSLQIATKNCYFAPSMIWYFYSNIYVDYTSRNTDYFVSGKLQLSVRHKILVKMFTKIIKKYAEKALNNNKHILKCLLRLILSLEIMI